jgi:cytochrome b subunit of formate dehydrogenase
MAEFFQPLRGLFEYVDQLPTSIAIRESQYFSPYLTVSHVFVMELVAGLVLMMDLRLMGLANMRTPFTELQRRLFPWQMFGMALAGITGVTLAYSDPMRFYSNIFFWMKMLMLVLAALNAMAFHYTTYYSVATWDSAPTPPLGAKMSGAISVILWSMIILAGRLIPYNWFAY